jgi:septal ring factor EnvC (AmiA/AmiB activator)
MGSKIQKERLKGWHWHLARQKQKVRQKVIKKQTEKQRVKSKLKARQTRLEKLKATN